MVHLIGRLSGEDSKIEVSEIDTLIIGSILTKNSAPASLYGSDDSATTQVNVGTGSSVTDIFIGGSCDMQTSLDIEGNNASNQFNAILLGNNTASSSNAAIINNGGASGDDLFFYNSTNNRFEFGKAFTLLGTVIPPAVALSNLRVNNINIESSVTSNSVLAIQANSSQDLNLRARGNTIPLNDPSNTSLAIFTNTSFIGILNEIQLGEDIEVPNLRAFYTNNQGAQITAGDICFINGEDSVGLSLADSISNLNSNYIGVAETDSNDGEEFNILFEGVVPVRFEPSLTLQAGEEIYISASTLGRATNVQPSSSGEVIQSIGFLRNALTYDGALDLIAEVNLIRGNRSVA